MMLFKQLKEMISNICQDWDTYRQFGVSRNEATWLNSSVRIPGFVRDIREVRDWDQKRGVYFLPMTSALRESMAESWNVDAGCSMYANDLIKKALKNQYPFYWFVFIHVYSDGYNHKVVVSDMVDPNFHMLSSYLEFCQDFARMHYTPYTTDLKTMIDRMNPLLVAW